MELVCWSSGAHNPSFLISSNPTPQRQLQAAASSYKSKIKLIEWKLIEFIEINWMKLILLAGPFNPLSSFNLLFLMGRLIERKEGLTGIRPLKRADWLWMMKLMLGCSLWWGLWAAGRHGLRQKERTQPNNINWFMKQQGRSKLMNEIKRILELFWWNELICGAATPSFFNKPNQFIHLIHKLIYFYFRKNWME